MDERLEEFEKAIKIVYASSMSLSALDYRKRRGLDKKDEQMALLVQRVSGSYYGSYYMPCAAGAGYSYSPYKFLEKIDPKAGMLLMVPGRICTSSPELGVPTTFADISEFEAICEMEETKAGYNPELSYGSHIFQDLVETEILYTAVFSNKYTVRFAPDKLREFPGIIDFFNNSKETEGIVHVYDMTGSNCELYNDLEKEHLIIRV